MGRLGLANFVGFADRFSWGILLFWLIVLGTTALFAPGLLNDTSQAFTPPAGSAASTANEQLTRDFSGVSGSTNLIVLLTVTNASASILDVPDTRIFSLELQSSLTNNSLTEQISGYYTLLQAGLPDFALGAFVSKSERVTLIQIRIGAYLTDASTRDYVKSVQSTIRIIKPCCPNISVDVMGAPVIIQASVDIALTDLERMDLIVLPFAFVVLGVLLQSWRLMLIPVASMATSVAVSFGIVALVAKCTPIYMITPSLMMSVLIAMAFDYALFLLTRFQEVRASSATMRDAVERILGTAGKTILVSGMTLLLSFLALLFFPMTMISSLGLGCAIALGVTISVNLTLVPALLLQFPTFFMAAAAPAKATVSIEESINQSLLSGHGTEEEVRRKGMWSGIGYITTTSPYNYIIIAAVIASAVPFAYTAARLSISDGWVEALPRGSDVRRTFDELGTEFGLGFIAPHTLLIEPEYGDVISADVFNRSAAMLDALGSLGGLHSTESTDISSAMYASGAPVPWSVVEQCQTVPVDPSIKDICAAVQYGITTFVNKTTNAAFATITLSWDPLSEFGGDWVADVRTALPRLAKEYGLRLWLAGFASDSYSAIDAVYTLVPMMVAVTCGCVLILVGASFKSLFIPLRSVFTIALTLFWAYGLAVLTFEHGLFDWTGFSGLQSQGALEWIVPVPPRAHLLRSGCYRY